jgi:hypothetical protein
MFSKDDLRELDICISKCKDDYIVYDNCLLCSVHTIHFEEINNDLTHFDNNDFDIMTVTRNGEVVYKRKENEFYIHTMHKNNDGLNKYYNDKSKLLKDIEILIDDKDLILLEVVKCNTN